MKGHKEHHHTASRIEAHIAKHRKAGGPVKGDDDAEKDLHEHEGKTSDVDDVEEEAEATKAKKGGRIKRKHGGMMKRHVGKVEGEEHKHHAGRKPRKSGGAACEADPFSSARHVTPAMGRKLEKETED
jgi:hypothetical protein